MKKYLKILFLLFSLILLSCENPNKNKPIIYLGENELYVKGVGRIYNARTSDYNVYYVGTLYGRDTLLILKEKIKYSYKNGSRVEINKTYKLGDKVVFSK